VTVTKAAAQRARALEIEFADGRLPVSAHAGAHAGAPAKARKPKSGPTGGAGPDQGSLF